MENVGKHYNVDSEERHFPDDRHWNEGLNRSISSPDEREEVEPADGHGEGPKFPLPVQPEAGLLAAGVEVEHHQDSRDVAEEVDDVVNFEVAQFGLQISYKFLSRRFLI